MQRHFLITLILIGSIVFVGCSGNDKNSIEASGTIEGTNINIGTEVTGKVKRLLVEEGSRVAAGDTLAVIDDTDYQIQLRSAEANAAASDAQYRLALEGSRKEDILQADAAFKTAESDYKRMKELLSAQTITQKQYDDVYTRYVAAQQNYQKLSRGLRKSEVDAVRARRDQAMAQADQLRKKIRDCYILAPSKGIVSLKSVEVGELVTMGANLVRITFLEKVKLMIYVNETQLGGVKVGQAAEVRIDSNPDQVHQGTVVYISPNAEFTPKNVQTKEERTKLVFGVKIEVENKDGVLKPGLPADARLVIN